jgi:hypothetical protein
MEHWLARVSVELAVQPANKVHGGRFRQRTFGTLPIHFGLNPHVSGGFDLQVPSTFIPVEFSGKRTRDFPRVRIVTLDKVAVVSVHHPYEVGEIRSGPGV